MMITISTSGGLAGFGLQRPASVDVEALPRELREAVCTRLAGDALAGLEARAGRGADRIVYHIAIEQAGEVRAYDLPEDALPPETLDLIDALLEAAATGG